MIEVSHVHIRHSFQDIKITNCNYLLSHCKSRSESEMRSNDGYPMQILDPCSGTLKHKIIIVGYHKQNKLTVTKLESKQHWYIIMAF